MYSTGLLLMLVRWLGKAGSSPVATNLNNQHWCLKFPKENESASSDSLPFMDGMVASHADQAGSKFIKEVC